MVAQHFREKLKDASAPFTDEVLDAMSDTDACDWLERNSDDPLLFHGCHDLTGKPKFLSRLDPPAISDHQMWFRDTETTYVALRVLAAADDSARIFYGICFHLCQQVIEKGVKAILALQCSKNGVAFKPKTYSHNLSDAIAAISTSLLPAAKSSRLRQVAEIFGADQRDYYVGKYAVDTGGGMGVGLDQMRPFDCSMRIVYDLFRSQLASQFSSVIDHIANDTESPGLFFVRCGIGPQQIKRALFWRNPVFFPNWESHFRNAP